MGYLGLRRNKYVAIDEGSLYARASEPIELKPARLRTKAHGWASTAAASSHAAGLATGKFLRGVKEAFADTPEVVEKAPPVVLAKAPASAESNFFPDTVPAWLADEDSSAKQEARPSGSSGGAGKSPEVLSS